MSNATSYGGLRLYREKSTANIEMCIALAGDSVVLGRGDAVKIKAAGATSIGSGPTVQAVEQVAAGDTIYGVVVGMQPIIEGTGSINLSSLSRPASTAQYVYVRRANHMDEYVIADDGAAAMTKANIGNNANLVAAVPDSYSGLSKMTLGAASLQTTATLQLKIKGVVDDATNDPASTGARWVVCLNHIVSSGHTGTVGV